MNDPLYRKEILRLAADAAGAGRLDQPQASATRANPACGDRVTVDVQLEGGRITALTHDTHACVLTQASASILGAGASGLSPGEVSAMAEAVRGFLAGSGAAPEPYGVFDGLLEHKGRHRCVLLPLEAALEALDLAEPGAIGAKG